VTGPAHWRFEPEDAPARLRSASDELEPMLASHGASVATQLAARLVCEELVLNAFEHGGARNVTLTADPEKDPHVLIFEDDGAPFDPAAQPPLEGTDAQGDVSTRGRGLILVRSFSRSIEHRLVEGRNRLEVLLVE
jgi:anti-sigma regulatory factor (Ser/Thr protein kinase)